MLKVTIFTIYTVFNARLFGMGNNDSIIGLAIFYFYLLKSVLYSLFSSSMYLAGTLQFRHCGTIKRIHSIHFNKEN